MTTALVVVGMGFVVDSTTLGDAFVVNLADATTVDDVEGITEEEVEIFVEEVDEEILDEVVVFGSDSAAPASAPASVGAGAAVEDVAEAENAAHKL